MKNTRVQFLLISTVLLISVPSARAFDLVGAIRSEIGNDFATASDNLRQYASFSNRMLRTLRSHVASGAEKSDRIAADLKLARQELNHQCTSKLNPVCSYLSYRLDGMDDSLAKGKLTELGQAIEVEHARIVSLSNLITR